MIQLTKLNGHSFILNCDLIKTIESAPDTVISLTNGEKLMVKEDVETVLSSIKNYRKRIYQEPICLELDLNKNKGGD